MRKDQDASSICKGTYKITEGIGAPECPLVLTANLLELKAKMLCEGVTLDKSVKPLFIAQNPYGIKRGGLSSGIKIELGKGLFVNAPSYDAQIPGSDLVLTIDSQRENGILITRDGQVIYDGAKILPAPTWYSEKVKEIPICRILTAHNRQVATAVYEDCALFSINQQCRFCVMRHSQTEKSPTLIVKSPELIISALSRIPPNEYGGLTLNGGMTFANGRGMELIVPVVETVRLSYPDLPIAVEATPPLDLDWINRLVAAGLSSLMMNLECWDDETRKQIIPGKNQYCPKSLYLKAFDRALAQLGPGRVSSCFVVGVEQIASLKEGIMTIIDHGVIPSPLAGRHFPDIQDYPFRPKCDWQEFLEIARFVRQELAKAKITSIDKAGCVACRMCDIIMDLD